LSKYLGSHLGGQHGCGQHGLGSQQRGFGGQHGSQQSLPQEQLVKERATAAINPKPRNFFIQYTPVNFRVLRIFNNIGCVSYYPFSSICVS
jgi:hypothetical protein